MGLKWKAFAIWLGIPFFSCFAIEPAVGLLFRHNANVARIFHWRNVANLLRTCAIPAALGTAILWLLPIRRAWLGIIVGALVASGGIAVYAWLNMKLFGGFEENVDIFVGALMLSLPSCVAGAFAGFLRAKEANL
jgi:hypothetical protein